MPGQTLLDINPDDLFEKHTIAEIQNVQTQIQNEIEKKREELRTMVGEKCRDLLKAADTITEMRETAQKVLLGISKVCENLQEKKRNGFKQPTTVTKKSKDTEEISRVIEIKILLSIPEQIWSAIERKDYLLSAQLFLLATHLHLGLEVATNAQKISTKYPVVGKQWEVIKSCKKVIIDGSSEQLKVINLPHEEASKCLSSLVLLEVMSFEKLLTQFLDLRLMSLETLLKSEELSRKKLRWTVELLQQTLLILFVCFLGKPKCEIELQLDSITNGEPTLLKIIQVSSLPQQYLSPLVVNFRPETSGCQSALSHDEIKTILSNWLAKVEKILQVQMTQLLNLVDDIKKLDKIVREDVRSLKCPQNWNEIAESLLDDPKLKIYDKFIKSYASQRVMKLIEITWEKNFIEVLSKLSEMDKDRRKESEKDIRWFVWKESKRELDEGLKLKTLGFTSRVMELCNLVNSFLGQLLNDVKLYVEDETNDGGDAQSILTYLNSCSLQMVKWFSKEVRESYKEKEDLDNESNLIIRARFLSSLTMLCPSLEKCLKPVEENFDDENKPAKSKWQEAVAHLNEESIQMWEMWRTRFSSEIRALVETKLHPDVSIRNLLRSKPLSEVIRIEEQAEDGTSVESDLKVPSQPSLPLQELLFSVCQRLNAVAPHTLPRKIHQDLVDDLVKSILERYQNYTQSEVIYQSQAWQMILDVRFLTLLIITKENKELSHSICDCLEKKIDPFDLDVCFPHLQNSVKKSAQKLQGTFGVLINFQEKLPVFNGLKLSQAAPKVEEPNLLAVSSNVPWFPLLPVTSHGSRRQDATSFDPSTSSKEKTSQRRRGEKENKKESMTSDLFKSAGAFFDAIGWS